MLDGQPVACVIASATADGKVSAFAGATDSQLQRVSGRDIVKEIAELVGGRGGGKPAMAQVGGSNAVELTHLRPQGCLVRNI